VILNPFLIKNELLNPIQDYNRLSRMKVHYSHNEFKEGTNYRRVFLFEDNGDAIMTDGSVYEDEFVVEADGSEDDSNGHYDGPEDT
jgi:hypothetical protein